MAYKVFSNGDALTGSELNTYLMNQSVMVFASTTARDAALTAPTEGMVVWLQDANKYVYYTGSAWADLITPASSGNAIINGAFDIWQRGTSFTSAGWTCDRWITVYDGTGATRTVSQQTFTPGTAPVAGYEGQYYTRIATTVAGSAGTYNTFATKIEDVRTFANQTVTFSFWGKADAARNTTIYIRQNFGSGGSGAVDTVSSAIALTTSWARYSVTLTMPSIAGKTIGTGSYLQAWFDMPVNTVSTFEFWGVQLEAGSVATPFKRNAPSIQAELAACQRYIEAYGTDKLYEQYGFGSAISTTAVKVWIPFGVTQRVAPSSVEYSLPMVLSDGAATISVTSITLNESTKNGCTIVVNVASGLTQFRPYLLMANNSLSSYLRFPSEL